MLEHLVEDLGRLELGAQRRRDAPDERQIDLLDPESAALADFSGLSYSEAFDAMIEKMRKEYAFTEYKQIDWDAKSAEFRPRFVAAEEAQDEKAYRVALRDFTWSCERPDHC